MRLRPQKSAPENAARLLPQLAQKFFQAGDETVQTDVSPEKVHPFRIETKRFRYSLEFFRPCYGATMDSYVKMIRDLQQTLGELNDCSSSGALYRDLLDGRPQKLLAAVDRHEVDLIEKFQSHWRDQFESPAVRQKFLRYLARPRKAPRRAARTTLQNPA